MSKHSEPPHFLPLPPLAPQKPPPNVLSLCRQQSQIQSLNLSAVPEQIEEDDTHQFQRLYHEKCQEEQLLTVKYRTAEETISNLMERNKNLEKEVSRLQEERWKKFDYSALSSARVRSKSNKRTVPTIEVKVPSRLKDKSYLMDHEQQYVKTDRDEESDTINYYKQQIAAYKRQVKQLNEEVEKLKKQLANEDAMKKKVQQESFLLKEKSAGEERGSFRSYSPISRSDRQIFQKAKTPQITDFSPVLKNSQSAIAADTVKKDFASSSSEQQVEVKRLKNQLMYKDLLLEKQKTDHYKEKNILQKHLELSVVESKRVAEQTTFVLGEFKLQLIRVTKQLDFEKERNNRLQLELKRFRGEANRNEVQIERVNSQPMAGHQLFEILKKRRGENLHG